MERFADDRFVGVGLFFDVSAESGIVNCHKSNCFVAAVNTFLVVSIMLFDRRRRVLFVGIFRILNLKVSS